MDFSTAKTREVYVAWTNTDLTEGRGAKCPLVVCESKETAEHLGKGCCVQGTDCRVTKEEAIVVGFHTYVPGLIVPDPEEIKVAREKKNIRDKVFEKARALGLTEQDLQVIVSKQ